MRTITCCILVALIFPFIKSQAQTDSFLYDGIMRSYHVHVPPSFSESDTLPLVFNLHGLLMNATSEESYSQMSPIADREHFIVVYGNGINNSWNSNGNPYHGGIDDVGFLSTLIDTIHKYYHINLNRVYSCGMSNGGFMSYRLACELSDRIAAIASVTGSMIDSMMFFCNATRPVPVMRVHGTNDPLVAFNGLGEISSADSCNSFWIQKNNCPSPETVTELPDINTSDNTTVTKYDWTACDNQSEVLFYKVNGGGHTWPGGSDIFVGLVGATNQDFSASEAIWEFFNQYDLQGKRNTVSARVPQVQKEFSVYPNPADDFITITSAAESVMHVRLNDLSGKTIMETDLKQNEPATLSLGSIPEGIYFLMCNGSGTKIVISH